MFRFYSTFQIIDIRYDFVELQPPKLWLIGTNWQINACVPRLRKRELCSSLFIIETNKAVNVIISIMTRNTVWYCYIIVNFLWNACNRHITITLQGRGMGCLLWTQNLIYVLRYTPYCYIQYHVMLDHVKQSSAKFWLPTLVLDQTDHIPVDMNKIFKWNSS